MKLPNFMAAAAEGAAVALDRRTMFDPIGDSDRPTLVALVRRVDRIARAHAPGEPPALNTDAALWGGTMLRWAAAMWLDRTQTGFETPPGVPNAAEPSAVWSVDLWLRMLPDVFGRAIAAGPEDPLVDTLRGVAATWPLSIAGREEAFGVMPDVGSMRTVRDHPSLRSMFEHRAGLIVHPTDAALAERYDGPR